MLVLRTQADDSSAARKRMTADIVGLKAWVRSLEDINSKYQTTLRQVTSESLQFLLPPMLCRLEGMHYLICLFLLLCRQLSCLENQHALLQHQIQVAQQELAAAKTNAQISSAQHAALRHERGLLVQV